MEKREISPTLLTLIGVSSITLLLGLVLFAKTGHTGYLWWMAGLSVAVGVGALLGSAEPSVTHSQGFGAIIIALIAYGPIRIPVRLFMDKPVDLGHELEIVMYCLCLAVALVAARWIGRRDRTEGGFM